MSKHSDLLLPISLLPTPSLLLGRPSLHLFLLLCSAEEFVVDLVQRLVLHARRDARLFLVKYAVDDVQNVFELMFLEP